MYSRVLSLLFYFIFSTAQQEAQRAHYQVEKAIQERQQKIVQAEGEAKAATLISFDVDSTCSQNTSRSSGPISCTNLRKMNALHMLKINFKSLFLCLTFKGNLEIFTKCYIHFRRQILPHAGSYIHS